MNDNNRNIVINDKDRTYVFHVWVMLRQEDMEKLRTELKKQIQQGCVLLPPYITLLNE